MNVSVRYRIADRTAGPGQVRYCRFPPAPRAWRSALAKPFHHTDCKETWKRTPCESQAARRGISLSTAQRQRMVRMERLARLASRGVFIRTIAVPGDEPRSRREFRALPRRRSTRGLRRVGFLFAEALAKSSHDEIGSRLVAPALHVQDHVVTVGVGHVPVEESSHEFSASRFPLSD